MGRAGCRPRPARTARAARSGWGGLPLSQILPNLFGNTIVLTPTGTPEVPNHSAHFKPGAEQLQTPSSSTSRS